jgi:hypothetical protein
MSLQGSLITVPASIVPFDLTTGIAALATLMLVVFVLAMVGLAFGSSGVAAGSVRTDRQSPQPSVDASEAD